MTSRRLLDADTIAMLKAADYIEQLGHCKHMLMDETGAVCLYGALNLTGMSVWTRSVIEAKLIGVLNLAVGYNGDVCSPLVQWNNAPERTADEVVIALRQAALS